MKKTIIPILSILIALALITLLSAGRTSFELKINDEIVGLSNPPLAVGTTIMLPIDEVLSHFGAEAKWRDEAKSMSCLYNNNFCKLSLGDSSVFINGIEEKYEPGPVLTNGVAYAPLSFFCNFLVLNSNQTESLIELSNRNTTFSTLFGPTAFQERTIANTDVKMSLPQNWQQLSETSIGVSNPYENYSFELNIIPNYTRFNTNAYIAQLISKTQKDLEKTEYKMDNMESSTYSTNDLMFDVFNYSTSKSEEKEKDKNKVKSEEKKDEKANQNTTTSSDKEEENKVKEKPIHHSHYILLYEGSLYDFHFRHNKFNAKNRVVKDFENGLKTLRLNKSSLNTYYEHYYEDEAFYDYGLELKGSIYSNMEIKDHILLEGSLSDPNIRELMVIVTKDGSLYEYPIEVKPNREFSSLVYSPFGVGKHNFSLYVETDLGREELLKFSALNISGTDIAYTIPSEKVISNSSETRDLLNQILEEAGKNRAYSSDYSVASTVFDYLKEVISGTTIDRNLNRDLAYDEINLSHPLSEKEVAILYCSLIRAAGIPCRIMQGENKEIHRVFTSCYINGSWFVYDLATDYYRTKGGTGGRNNEDYLPELRYSTSKHLSVEKYNEVFESIVELKY